MDVEVGVIAPNVSKYRYPVFMLIDLVAMTAGVLPWISQDSSTRIDSFRLRF